jgi:hypothetical protein
MLTLLLDLGERNDREVGTTIKKEDDFVLLNYQEYPELLDLDTKNWSLDKAAIWSLLRVEGGDSMTFNGCPYKEARVLEGARAISRAAPLVGIPI